jgi:hypothetical protein
MLLSKRKYILGAALFFTIGVFWPNANSQLVDKQDWSSKIRTTSDIAELQWEITFNIGSAPPASFAYVSSHGRDLVHGFHLTIDLYGNGFLVLTDIGEKSKGTQIVLLGQPITGTHHLEMSFQQSDKKIRWRSVEIFFDGVEVPFVSADPKRSIELKNINFVPENSDASIEPNTQKSGEIIHESLTVKTWPKSNHTPLLRALTLLTSLVFLSMFLQQCRTRKHR